jgi:2-dehydro-3-deoxyphosphogluconate aldolase/(4S)-4-hydroxy-2-oxoglutarate aldolase
MPAQFDDSRLQSLPLVLILRGFDIEQVAPIVNACKRGGLTNLEITMNSTNPEQQIQEAIQAAGNEMNIGAGTVTNMTKLEAAQNAGANFIVTPTLDLKIMKACKESSLPIFPGALTPTENHTAWKAGARMVKIFPSNLTGPGFIKAIRGPFPNIQLMPTGGVNLKTIKDYLAAGATGFGIGSPVLNMDRIKAKDWNWLTEQVQAFQEIYQAFKTPS